MTRSVKNTAEHFDVSVSTVLAWIASGELRAINVARKVGSRRPTWRITDEAIAAFETARTPSPPPPRTRRRKQNAIVNYY